MLNQLEGQESRQDSEGDGEDTNDASLIRVRSPVTSTFPWLSNVIGERLDIRTCADSEHSLYGFLDYLRSFERKTLFNPNSPEGKRYRHFLQVEYVGSSNPELQIKKPSKRNATDANALASLVCAFRLADIVAMTESELPRPNKVIPRRPKEGPAAVLPEWGKLADWPSVLVKFKTTFEQERAQTPLRAGTSILKRIVHSGSAGDLNNITQNIFIAALHLSYLMVNDFGHEKVPELTSDLEVLSKLPIARGSAESPDDWKLTKEEEAYWKDLLGQTNGSKKGAPPPGRERQPLYYALALTPFTLLLTTQLSRVSFGRENLLHTCVSLGNLRPNVIRKGEKLMWRTLFQMGSRQITPEAGIQQILDQLEWDEIKSCTHEERTWFKALKKQDSPSTSIHNKVFSSVALVPEEEPSDERSFAAPGESFRGLNRNEEGEEVEEPDAAQLEALLDKADQEYRASLASSLQDGDSPMLQAAPVASLTEEQPSSPRFRQLNPPVDSRPPSCPPPSEQHVPLRSEQLNAFVDVPPPSHPHPHEEDQGSQQDATVLPQRSDKSPPSHPAVSVVPGWFVSQPSPPTDPSPTPSTPAAPAHGQHPFVPPAAQLNEADSDSTHDASTRESSPLTDPSPMDIDGDEPIPPAERRDTAMKGAVANSEQTKGLQPLNTPSSVTPTGPTTRAKSGVAPPNKPPVQNTPPSANPTGPTTRAKSGVAPPNKPPPPPAPPATGNPQKRKPTGTKKTKPPSTPPPSVASEPSVGEKRKEAPHSDMTGQPDTKKNKATLGSKGNPIDLDAYALAAPELDPRLDPMKVTLKPTLTSPAAVLPTLLLVYRIPYVLNIQRFSLSNPFVVLDGDLNTHSILPQMHNMDEIVKLDCVFQAVKNSYVNGRPRLEADPASSVFRVMTHAAFLKLSHADVQKILRRQCLVVTQCPWRDMQFDKNGLRLLASLDSVVSIQDLSLPTPAADMSDRVVYGTVSQFLESAQAPESHRKALNGLSFPLTNDGSREFEPHESCRAAWTNTAGSTFKREVNKPVGDINWGLAATAGTHTPFHIDTQGFGTVVDVRTGAKLWIIYSDSFEKVAKIGFFLSEGFELDQPPQTFGTEAILLTAATRLYMGPGYAHSVYTPDNTICHGSHFFATAFMQQTLVSFIHAFICHGYITNIAHPDAHVLFRRLIHFYHRGLVQGIDLTDDERAHLPNLFQNTGEQVLIDDALNFLSLCVLNFLSNALDQRTYEAPRPLGAEKPTKSQRRVMEACDANSISKQEREDIIEARGVAIDAFAWFRRCFSVQQDGKAGSVDLPSTYLVQLARTLLRYKHAAVINKIKSASSFTVGELEKQLENVLELDARTWKLWERDHQGRWLDEEMKRAANVLINKRPAFGEGLGKEVVEERVDVDMEDGEIQSTMPSRRIKVESIPFPATFQDKDSRWREETLMLENAASYRITRNGAAFISRTKKWAITGATHLDDKYREAMEWHGRESAAKVKARWDPVDEVQKHKD